MGRILAPHGRQQLVAVHPPEAVEHEVGQEQSPVGAGQRLLDSPSVEPHHKPAAELDSRAAGHAAKVRQDRRKVGETTGRDHRSPYNPKGQQ